MEKMLHKMIYSLLNELLLFCLALATKRFFTEKMRFKFKAVSVIWMVYRALYYTFCVIMLTIVLILGIMLYLNELVYLNNYERHYGSWIWSFLFAFNWCLCVNGFIQIVPLHWARTLVLEGTYFDENLKYLEETA